MVAPVVTIYSDPTQVQISFTALSASTNGGITLDGYKIEVLMADGEFSESGFCYG
jgi:hypothetical protein